MLPSGGRDGTGRDKAYDACRTRRSGRYGFDEVRSVLDVEANRVDKYR
jgi:hypothetical protein